MYPDYIPLEIGIPAAIITWLVLGYLVIRDALRYKVEVRKPTSKTGFYINTKNGWIPMQNSFLHDNHNVTRQKNNELYDQEADK